MLEDVKEGELIDEHGEGDSKTNPCIMLGAEARVRDMLRELFQYRTRAHYAEVRACLHAIGCDPARLMDQPLKWELLTGDRLGGGEVGRELDRMLERRAADEPSRYAYGKLREGLQRRVRLASDAHPEYAVELRRLATAMRFTFRIPGFCSYLRLRAYLPLSCSTLAHPPYFGAR